MNPGHPAGQCKIRMREVDAAWRRDGLGFGDSRRHRAMTHPGRADQDPLLGGVLDGPGLAPVPAASEQMLLGFVVVDVVASGSEVLVIPRTEADKDLVPPRPDTVIGRPAAEAARLVVDL